MVGSHSLSIFDQSVAVLPKHLYIFVVPHLFCCPPTSPPLPYPSLLSCISATVIVRRCLQQRPCLPPPLSCISAAPPLSSSRVSVAVLILLSLIVPCTLLPLFVYLLRSDIILALRRSVLHWLLRSDPHYFSHSPLWYSHYAYIFSFSTPLLYLYDVVAPLRSATFFLHLPSLYYTPIWSFPSTLSAPICLPHLWYAQLWFLQSCSDLIAHICLDQHAHICSIFRFYRPSNLS